MCGALAISAVGVEQGAREVEPLLDIDRVGGVLQPSAHLLGDRHEQVVEDLEHHRVGAGAEGVRAPGAARRARAPGRRSAVSSAASRLDHGGGVGLGDDRGPGDPCARAARRRGSTRRRVAATRSTGGACARSVRCRRAAPARGAASDRCRVLAAAASPAPTASTEHRLDHHRARPGRGTRNAGGSAPRMPRASPRHRRQRHGQPGVRAVIAQRARVQ